MERILISLAQVVGTNPRFFRQFAKFAVVGAIGTIIDVSILVFLKEVVGLNVYVANSISFSSAVINNYLLNSYWTFADQDRQPKKQFVQFFIVSVVGLALSELLLAFFHDYMGLYYLIAKVLGILVVLFWNFFANRFWTFRE
jgi:putative flippase GtrA